MSVCRAVKLPTGDACQAPATWRITFRDGDSIETCHACTMSLTEIAKSHGTTIKTERLEHPT